MAPTSGGKLTIGPREEAKEQEMPMLDANPTATRRPSPRAPCLVPIQPNSMEVGQEADSRRQANPTVSQQASVHADYGIGEGGDATSALCDDNCQVAAVGDMARASGHGRVEEEQRCGRQSFCRSTQSGFGPWMVHGPVSSDKGSWPDHLGWASVRNSLGDMLLAPSLGTQIQPYD